MLAALLIDHPFAFSAFAERRAHRALVVRRNVVKFDGRS
jgi:hypothetical protein